MAKRKLMKPVRAWDLSTDEAPVHRWFELSYASFLVLPRVLMEAMSLAWQRRMVACLREYEEAFPNQPNIGTRIQITQNGKLIKPPKWLLDYRRPDQEAIAALREAPRKRKVKK